MTSGGAGDSGKLLYGPSRVRLFERRRNGVVGGDPRGDAVKATGEIGLLLSTFQRPLASVVVGAPVTPTFLNLFLLPGGDPSAWDEEYLTSSAEAAIVWGRHQMLDPLRVKEMPVAGREG